MPILFSSSDISFAFRSGFSTPNATELVIGDFNGDGKADLMVGYVLAPFENRVVPIRVLGGDGAGGFSDVTATLFPNGAPTTFFAHEAVPGDFNRDGRLDVFYADLGFHDPSGIGSPNTLVMSSGTSGLINASSRLPPINTNFSHSAEAADIDGDGDLDIFIGNGGNPRPYFLINDGAGNFTLSRTGLPAIAGAPYFDGSETWNSEAFLDVDRDGDLDLFLGTSGATYTPNRLFINDGRGNFTVAPVNPPMPVTPGPIGNTNYTDAKTFDVNGDGFPDVISTFARDGGAPSALAYVQVLINNGDLTFRDETVARLPPSTRANVPEIGRVQIIDMNGDGYLDIFAYRHARTPIYLNDGTGRFVEMPESTFITNELLQSRWAGDVNGDGRVDVISWRGAYAGVENFRVNLRLDQGLTQTGTASADGFMGDGDSETINGAAGNDVIFGGGGVNYLRGDEGADTIVGGVGFDDINGNMGDDSCMSGGGDDWVVGGRDNDSLLGGNGANLVYGNLGNDVCDGGGGNDIVRGGQDNDIVVGGAGDDYVSGDRGSDTMTGGAGADIFHSFGDAGIDRVTDFNLAQGDRVQLDPGTVFTVSQSGADTVINMTGGGQMILVGIAMSSLTPGWIFGA